MPSTIAATMPSMPSSDITGTGDSFKGMILAQVNRITYLLTLGNARYDGPQEMFSEKSMAKSALRGMQVLEAMLKPIQDKNYNERTTPIKKQALGHLKNFSTQDIQYFDCIAQWLEIVIEHLDKLNMIPEEEMELEFD